VGKCCYKKRRLLFNFIPIVWYKIQPLKSVTHTLQTGSLPFSWLGRKDLKYLPSTYLPNPTRRRKLLKIAQNRELTLKWFSVLAKCFTDLWQLFKSFCYNSIMFIMQQCTGSVSIKSWLICKLRLLIKNYNPKRIILYFSFYSFFLMDWNSG
jgi:hypothetical protein